MAKATFIVSTRTEIQPVVCEPVGTSAAVVVYSIDRIARPNNAKGWALIPKVFISNRNFLRFCVLYEFGSFWALANSTQPPSSELLSSWLFNVTSS